MIPMEWVADVATRRNFETLSGQLPGARFHLLMSQRNGALPQSATYTPSVASATQYLIVAGTGSSSAAGVQGAIDVSVDGTYRWSAFMSFTASGVHHSFPLFIVDASLYLTSGASHTILLSNGGNLVTDSTDHFTVAVLESN